MATLATNSICTPTPRFRTNSFGISAYIALLRQRRALANLDQTRLNDLGISARDAACEAKKPIWDVPNHWRR